MTAAELTGYEALRQSAAWLDLSSRGKIRVLGEDRARLLHAMSTNHIEQLVPGLGSYAYFLSAQGRILSDAAILCRPDHFLLDTEPETRAKLYEHLDRYIIADDVTLEDATDQLSTIGIEGPAAGDILRELGAQLPQADYASTEWGDSLVVRTSYTGEPGYFVITSAAETEQLIARLEQAGVPAAAPSAFETVRIENGKPRYGQDLSERFLAQEANQPQALHFSKGCYLGQEIVERVRSRGQVHRVLMRLQLSTSEPPPSGTKLTAGGAPVSEITSAVFAPSLGKVAALAYVRSEQATPGDVIEFDSGFTGEVLQPWRASAA